MGEKLGVCAHTLDGWAQQARRDSGEASGLPTDEIEEHKDRFGVEPICRVLDSTERGFITSRRYRAAKTRVRSARSLQDDLLVPEIQRIHVTNYSVYGVPKIWQAMRREGWQIGRDQVYRLMRKAELTGAVRGRKPRTTVPARCRIIVLTWWNETLKLRPRGGFRSQTSPMSGRARASCTPPSSSTSTAVGPWGGLPAPR